MEPRRPCSVVKELRLPGEPEVAEGPLLWALRRVVWDAELFDWQGRF